VVAQARGRPAHRGLGFLAVALCDDAHGTACLGHAGVDDGLRAGGDCEEDEHERHEKRDPGSRVSLCCGSVGVVREAPQEQTALVDGKRDTPMGGSGKPLLRAEIVAIIVLALQMPR
jgi:hypothetical protein